MSRKRRKSVRRQQAGTKRSRFRSAGPERLEQRLVLDSTVVFNEVMYHPADDNNALEWIELYNQLAVDMDVTGWTLQGGVDLTLDGTTMVDDNPGDPIVRITVPGREYMVIASDPVAFEAAMGFAPANTVGWSGNLSDGGEELRLFNRDNRRMSVLDYRDGGDWPVGPDGGGATLAKFDPSTDSELAANWRHGEFVGGSPGAANFNAPIESVRELEFNEIEGELANEFFIEVVNRGDNPDQTGNYEIRTPAGSVVLPDHTLNPGEIVAFTEAQIGFRPADNDLLVLVDNDSSVSDARKATNSLRGQSTEHDDRWLWPDAPTPGTENSFAFVDEIVINEIMYHAFPQLQTDLLPYASNPEEWIEIYNRGETAVDLSGWRFDDAIDFTFPAQTSLEPDEYLVIAKDAVTLAAKYPGITIIGDFSGGLGNTDDNLLLKDVNGNPADEVHYYERGKWPEFADGGGSSLELRDPNADNNRGSAWAASDETAKSQWTNYTYTAAATEPICCTDFNELVFGLLDSGEFLIDDVVLRRNGGNNLINNGTFQGDSIGASPSDWRFNGNHSGTIVEDPENAARKVLHVVASGTQQHVQDNIDIGLNQPISTATHTISFRIKWLTGNAQLNNRLFYTRMANTAVMEVPTNAGTPGAQNSAFETNIGPTYTEFSAFPVLPDNNEPVTVSARPADPDGIALMTLMWSDNGGAWSNVDMVDDGSGLYSGAIPGHGSGTVIQFYVEGEDSLGATSAFPADGELSRALYEVVNGGQEAAQPVDTLRLVMLSSDRTAMINGNRYQQMTNLYRGVTMIVNGQTVYYDVDTRLIGSGYIRPNSGYKVRLDPDQKYYGLHDTLRFDINGVREVLLKQMVNRAAGGSVSMYDDISRVAFSGAPGNGSTMILGLARYEDIYLDEQFVDGGDGTKFEMDDVTRPSGGGNGSPHNGRTMAAMDMQNRGEDPEAYRGQLLIKNNRTMDDYESMATFSQALYGVHPSVVGTDLDLATQAVMDVDLWMRHYATQAFIGNWDTYGFGRPKNLRIYVRPEDGKAIPLFWDADLNNWNADLTYNGGSSRLDEIRNIPTNKRLFWGHMLDIVEQGFNGDFVAPWVTHYASLGVTNLDSASTIASRATRAINEARNPATEGIALVDFDVTTNGGDPHTVNELVVTLDGDGWVDVREIRLAGNSLPLDVTWTDEDSWQVIVPIGLGTSDITLEAYGFQGNLVGTDTITVTSTATELGVRENLRITEVNYNPFDPTAEELATQLLEDSPFDNDDFEFVELQNVGTSILDLTNVRFIKNPDGDGLLFDFAGSDVDTLPPGEFVLVVANETAFEARYGDDLPVAGVYSGGLGNGGEEITLVEEFNFSVQQFTYDNSGSWPGRADGKGSTLEVLDTSGDYNDPDNWRSSGEFNGSPGEEGQGLDRRVVINELLTHTDPPQTDTIELLNTTDAPIDVGGWYLSDNNNRYNKFRIPDGTIIAARGYLVFDENDFNVSLGVDPNDFALNGAHGDDVYLLSGDASDNVLDFIDHVEVGAALNGISYGRWPDETSRLVPMQWNSFGRENAYPVMPDLMISEIHYNPAHATPRAWTKQAGNWQLTGGHLESSGDPTGSVNYLATVDAEQTDVRVDVTVNFPEELNSAPAYGLFDMDASGIIGRYNSSFDFVVTGIRQFSGEVGVWKYAGIWTEVVTPVAIPGGVVVGDDYRLSATFDGTMITVSVNGFELISADTSVNTIGAQFGLRALSEGDQFDDFLVTPFDGSPLTTDSFSRDSTSGLGMTDELGNDLEFVEIYNASDATIDLTGWRLRKGIDYDFVEPGASAVSLDAGETIVVLSFNPADPLNADRTAQFRSGHEIDASVVLVGGYGGKLSNNGESIELQRPDMPPLLEPDFTPHIVTDRVVYEAVAPWPDVLISFESLNRTSIDTFGHESASWQASAPTPGSAVMNVAAPRVVGVGAGGPVYGTSQVIEASAAGITTLEIYFNAPQFLLGPTRVLDGAIQLDDNGQSGSGTYRQFDLDAAAMHRWLEVTTGSGLPAESLFVGQLLGDLDGDHAIGAGDLSRLFGSATSTDITGDGITNAADLAQILAMWGDALPEIPLGDPAISDIATEVIDAALVELSTEPAVMGPLPTLIAQPIGPQEVSSFSRLRTRRTLRPELPDEPTTRLARRRRLLRSAVDVVIEEDTFRRWR